MRFLIVAMALALVPKLSEAACRDDQVRVRGDFGETSFLVEIADTIAERSRGLMFRESMPRRSGMLFVYDRPGPASFWMKNTLIPLDMIFIDQTGTVAHIHHEAIPGDLTAIHGGSKVLAVLEINGGLAQQYGLSVGDQVQHPAFLNGPPIWPC